ncbi:MAG TPA: hypothetical protein VHQ43_04890 [Solirubrobacterales bacterium]|nr:hypothetical protein [Solirubrobacterales bacterium]
MGVAVTLVAPPAAEATFHLISVREVFAGSSAAPQAEYVELQMYSGGQDLVGGHTLSFYDGAGASSGSASFGGDVANGANQSTVLAATPAAESLFGVAADTSMPADSLDPSGGAVCWESLDCVAWGSFHGTVLSAVGSPADSGGIPDGLALRRSIAPGCSTLLEAADDSDSSAADFFDAAPAPRPNSVAPSEHVCAAPGKEGGETGAGGGGGGAGKGAGGRPQTTIRSGPPHRSRRRTATFRFVSSKPGATFVCKLDGGRFKRCRSPYTLRGLAVGHHVFRVTARLGGVADPSPARWAFRVLPRR